MALVTSDRSAMHFACFVAKSAAVHSRAWRLLREFRASVRGSLQRQQQQVATAHAVDGIPEVLCLWPRHMPWTVFQKSRPSGLATIVAGPSGPVAAQSSVCGHGTCRGQCSRSPGRAAWPQLWLALQGRPLRSPLFVATAHAVDSVPEVQAERPGHNCCGQCSRSPGRAAWPQLLWTVFQKSRPSGLATFHVPQGRAHRVKAELQKNGARRHAARTYQLSRLA
jgi:hypothetical protein